KAETDLPNFYTGPIASTNGNWILSGHWMAFINQSNINSSGFHSMFYMVMENGSSSHIHTIGNATGSSIAKEANNTIMKANVSVTMENGPVSNVPVFINVSNNNTVTIYPDPSKVNDHFGNSTIKGLVSNHNNTSKMTQMMISDPEAQKKWNPLMERVMVNNMLRDAIAKDNNLDVQPGNNINMSIKSP
ncbi:MAG: hypothetical protein M3162_07180, partial [Thermoproteota archaeon]|nr:hypothetical protein [Thermoproteota archaeon]